MLEGIGAVVLLEGIGAVVLLGGIEAVVLLEGIGAVVLLEGIGAAVLYVHVYVCCFPPLSHIKVTPAGMSRPIKKLIKTQVPDLHKYKDIADFVMRLGLCAAAVGIFVPPSQSQQTHSVLYV